MNAYPKTYDEAVTNAVRIENNVLTMKGYWPSEKGVYSVFQTRRHPNPHLAPEALPEVRTSPIFPSQFHPVGRRQTGSWKNRYFKPRHQGYNGHSKDEEWLVDDRGGLREDESAGYSGGYNPDYRAMSEPIPPGNGHGSGRQSDAAQAGTSNQRYFEH